MFPQLKLYVAEKKVKEVTPEIPSAVVRIQIKKLIQEGKCQDFGGVTEVGVSAKYDVWFANDNHYKAFQEWLNSHK